MQSYTQYNIFGRRAARILEGGGAILGASIKRGVRGITRKNVEKRICDLVHYIASVA